MDELDNRLLSALHRDARASLSELAQQLGVTRTTVRSRMQRLKQSGEIVGFTVLTRRNVAQSPVRGLMMLEIEGRGTERDHGPNCRHATGSGRSFDQWGLGPDRRNRGGYACGTG